MKASSKSKSLLRTPKDDSVTYVVRKVDKVTISETSDVPDIDLIICANTERRLIDKPQFLGGGKVERFFPER